MRNSLYRQYMGRQDKIDIRHQLNELELQLAGDDGKRAAGLDRVVWCLAELKFRFDENTTSRIMEIYRNEFENIDWERDYPSTWVLAGIQKHFVDCVFNHKWSINEGYGGRLQDITDAKKFLADCLIDESERSVLFEWLFRDNGMLYGGMKSDFFGEDDIIHVLSDVEYVWKLCTTNEKKCYVRLLLEEGSLESLRKADGLTRKERSMSISNLRRCVLLKLYRDYPDSFHSDDPEYFMRKIEEMPDKGNSQGVVSLAELISSLRVTGWIGSGPVTPLEAMEDGVLIEISEQVTRHLEYKKSIKYSYGEAVSPIWGSLSETLVGLFKYYRKRRYPLEVLKTMRELGMKMPTYYYEDLICSGHITRRVEVANGLSTKYDPEEILDLTKFHIMSQDPDRRVRRVVALKLGALRRRIEKKHMPYLKGGMGIEEGGEISEIQSPIDNILREMLERDGNTESERRHIRESMGESVYGF